MSFRKIVKESYNSFRACGVVFSDLMKANCLCTTRNSLLVEADHSNSSVGLRTGNDETETLTIYHNLEEIEKF